MCGEQSEIKSEGEREFARKRERTGWSKGGNYLKLLQLFISTI